jgi:hypothetical protein
MSIDTKEMRIRAQTLREFGFNQTARLHENAADEIDRLRERLATCENALRFTNIIVGHSPKDKS